MVRRTSPVPCCLFVPMLSLHPRRRLLSLPVLRGDSAFAKRQMARPPDFRYIEATFRLTHLKAWELTQSPEATFIDRLQSFDFSYDCYQVTRLLAFAVMGLAPIR